MTMKKQTSLFVERPPDWRGRSPVTPRLIGLPTTLFGMQVECTEQVDPAPVFIGQVALPGHGDAYVYGVRFEMSSLLLEGKSLGDGHVVEYVIVHADSGGEVTEYRLRQHAIVYSTEESNVTGESARDVNSRRYSLRAAPRWKIEDASWPTEAGSPMMFVAQFELVENEVTRTALTWGKHVFVFWKADQHRSVFALTTQNASYQSAEDHYASEQ